MNKSKLKTELPITSSTSLNYNYNKVGPAKAHDKNLTTFYRSKTANSSFETPWIELSVASDVEIGVVAIVNRLRCYGNCSRRLQNTKVEAFNSAETLLRACGIVDGVEGFEGEASEADETYFVDCGGVKAKTVRLTDMDNVPNEMNVAEVTIYGFEKGSSWFLITCL